MLLGRPTGKGLTRRPNICSAVLQSEPPTLLVRQRHIRPPIVVDEQDVLPVVAPLGNVMRQAGDDDACELSLFTSYPPPDVASQQ